jgi:hypothetical protein
MADYELTFELDELDEAQEDRIYEAFDAMIAVHGSTTLMTCTARGATTFAAAKGTVAELAGMGVVAIRLYEDLVGRAQIAERAGVTTQAVGLWVRGERQAQSPFPAPYHVAAGGLWLWADVNAWLAAQGKEDGFAHPRRADYLQTNSWLDGRAAPHRMAVPRVVQVWRDAPPAAMSPPLKRRTPVPAPVLKVSA